MTHDEAEDDDDEFLEFDARYRAMVERQIARGEHVIVICLPAAILPKLSLFHDDRMDYCRTCGQSVIARGWVPLGTRLVCTSCITEEEPTCY